jgi:nitrous oxidase accessory protein
MNLRIAFAFALLVGWLFATPPTTHAANGPVQWVVSPAGPYTSITSALAQANAGDVIEVRGGRYDGPLVIAKSVTLNGVGWPVIDGRGRGTVVTLSAAGAVIRGFEIINSGDQPDEDHAGIMLAAPRTAAKNNRLREVLFGIFIAKAENAVVRGNDVDSMARFDYGRKGDGIRLWYSSGALIENNTIHDTRDLVAWYSHGVVLRGNTVARNRYGVHLMFCNQLLIERNQFIDNHVGVFAMYSNDVVMRDNVLQGHRGPSGYAFGFKEADNVTVLHNVIVNNRGGFYLDSVPFSKDGISRISDNIIAFNDTGVILLPATRGNRFEGNTFWENVEQVGVAGGTATGKNVWRGNYWSDYTGYDLNGDDIGDVPHRADRFFEGALDRQPMLRVLLYSPAMQAIEMAAEAFPIVRPQPKLVDEAPRMTPAAIPAMAQPAPAPRWPFALLSFGLLAASAGVSGLTLVNRRMAASGARTCSAAPNAIAVSGLTKRFGHALALDDVSFTLERGRALAVWGVNGAGKSTLIKAMLGLLHCEGHIVVADCDVRRHSKQARRAIGYVPQELAFYDWSVRQSLLFYARLKRADVARIETLLDQLGLREHAHKLVSALSGGLKQRLALTIALLADPPVLLLDEPTASLDSTARLTYLAQLRVLRESGKTILFSSHHLDEVDALADEVLVMEAGRIIARLSPAELRERMRHTLL